ncbi:MAG: GntR family transcriptional regulator [Salinisphaeraceae bacterium]|nr:GntR family transcriptional regulator [Salinisphaeraceae bacterium]
MFETVAKQSLSEAVFDQLRSRIISGDLSAGDELPSERILCEMLGVNRGAVREGIKRLQQAGLVQVRHGGPTLVLNFEQEAGLEMLPALMIDEEGNMRVEVARGIISLRENLAPSVARQAANRTQAATADRLDTLLNQMRETDDIEQLQDLVFGFWDALVQGSGNIAYKLAFNSLRKTYKKIWGLLTQTLAAEFRDIDNLSQLAKAIRHGKAEEAEAAAKAHVAIGSEAMNQVLDAYESGQSKAFSQLNSVE